MTTALGIDIGGTKVSAAYIIGEQIVSTSRIDYNRATIVESIAGLKDELVPDGEALSKVGISCAGLVDVKTGEVKFAGNLEMENFQLGAEVEVVLKVPVSVDNDARCATLGEFVNARGAMGSNVAGLILGTGVGGGLIINGRLLQGKNSFGGEIGHLPVTNALKQCACGLFGCLESVAGGRAFEQDFENLTGLRRSALDISDLADQGDPDALDSFRRVGFAIGQVMAQLDTALDLDTVVIGGGFGNTFRHWEMAAMESYSNHLVGATRRQKLHLKLGALGSSSQLLGAVADK